MSIAHCDYSVSDVCPVCGRRGVQGATRMCTGGQCAHRSKAAIGVALVRCETCQGNVRKKKPLFACAVFGQCVTVPTAEGEAKSCVGCLRKEMPRPAEI